MRDVALRGRRMLRLSSRLRRLVGDSRAVGAIVPDPVTQRYWPRFPWRAVRRHYDVCSRCATGRFRVDGRRAVQRFARQTLRAVRVRSGDPAVPVHVIGSIADDASVAEVAGFVSGAVGLRAAGASLYEASVTRRAQWRRMAPVARLRSEAPRRSGVKGSS